MKIIIIFFLVTIYNISERLTPYCTRDELLLFYLDLMAWSEFVKQALHCHEFCSRNASQYGVPSRAILVARSLSR